MPAANPITVGRGSKITISSFACLSVYDPPQVVSHSKREGAGGDVSAGNTARTQSGCTLSNRVVPGPDTKIDTL